MTEKLFDADSYLSEFQCKVINLYVKDGKICVETDRTAFFPEGGGQTSDRGWLENCYVENVQIIDGHIIHFVENSEENVKTLQKEGLICGKIDMKKRFSDMQQHTGKTKAQQNQREYNREEVQSIPCQWNPEKSHYKQDDTEGNQHFKTVGQ